MSDRIVSGADTLEIDELTSRISSADISPVLKRLRRLQANSERTATSQGFATYLDDLRQCHRPTTSFLAGLDRDQMAATATLAATRSKRPGS